VERVDEVPVKFFLSNRKIGQHFVDTFHKSRKR
jgi:hypothetical protein